MIDVVDVVELAVGVKVVIERPDLHVARGQNQVRIVHRPHDIHDAELMRLEFQRIDIDHDLPIAPAERLRHRGARHIRHLVADRVLAQIAQLRLVHPLAFQRDQADRQARGVELQNDRRQRARAAAAANSPSPGSRSSSPPSPRLVPG